MSDIYRAVEDTVLNFLLRSESWYGYVLVQLQVKPASDIPIAAVQMNGDRIQLLVNPENFISKPLKERSIILKHEISHICFEHFARCGARHPILFNVAADLAVNSLIGNVPAYMLMPNRMNTKVRLPEHADAETYYNLLREACGGDGGAGKMNVKIGEQGEIIVSWDGDGSGGVDFHPGWRESSGQPELAEAAVRHVIDTATKAAGSVPGELKSTIDGLFQPRIYWERQLRLFVGKTRGFEREMTYTRLNKKVPMLPGFRRKRIGRILFGIDTSGSIWDEQLQMFASELYGITKIAGVSCLVAECDSEIQDVYTLTSSHLRAKMKNGFKGRGGTCFNPIFELAKKEHVNGVIYLTDGYNFDQLPEHPPVPTLWVITDDGKKPTEWGWEIRLPRPKKMSA
jgi:predicted metal-dependent peptidase